MATDADNKKTTTRTRARKTTTTKTAAKKTATTRAASTKRATTKKTTTRRASTRKAAPKKVADPIVVTPPTHAEIAQRAYDLFQAGSRDTVANWFQAENELKAARANA